MRDNAEAEAERIYAALADGGKILIPPQETFSPTQFGQVHDRFGINCLHERTQPA